MKPYFQWHRNMCHLSYNMLSLEFCRLLCVLYLMHFFALRSDLLLVSTKGIFIGRTDAEAPIFWPPDMKSQLIGKYPDAGKDWKQKVKGAAENEMVIWHHQFNDMSLSKLGQIAEDRGAWCALAHGVAKSRTWLSAWTTTTKGRKYERGVLRASWYIMKVEIFFRNVIFWIWR